MATSSLTKDTTEKFFRCTVCLGTMREPKILPCVHRFCDKCLQKIIGDRKAGTSLKCPLCREKCRIPEGGAAGFKTDFHLKAMLEYVELNGSLSTLEIDVSSSSCEETVAPMERGPQAAAAFRGIRYIGARGIEVEGYVVYDMTSCERNGLVITGRASDAESFIAVTDAKGRMTRYIRFPRRAGSKWQPFRYCDALSQHEIVTVCQTNQLGIYNVRDCSVTQKNISDVVSGWTPGCFISCVTSDPRDRTILVGSMSKDPTGVNRDVLVFDERLKYRHTLTLPAEIRGARDIAVHNRNLIVCDRHGGASYEVNMKGKIAKVVHEFAKPHHGIVAEGSWYPLKVCTDSDGFVFILWGALVEKHQRRMVTKYAQSKDRQLIETMPLHCNTMCICSPVKEYSIPWYKLTQCRPTPGGVGVAGPGI